MSKPQDKLMYDDPTKTAEHQYTRTVISPLTSVEILNNSNINVQPDNIPLASMLFGGTDLNPETANKILSQYGGNEGTIIPSKSGYIPMQKFMCEVPNQLNLEIDKLPSILRLTIRFFKKQGISEKLKIKRQKYIENALVEMGSCSGMNRKIMDGLRVRIFSIDAERLDRILESTDTLSHALHDNVSCVVQSILYPEEHPIYEPLIRERIRNWFTNVKQIGGSSEEGYAFETSFSEDTQLFVVKAPKNPYEDDIVHEAAVGFLALNKLRRYAPNFMYVYGYTRCSAPIFENGNPVTWCTSSSPSVSYLITENIKNSETMAEFAVNPKVLNKDLILVYIQLFNALNVAYKECGYTHYDLHANNILVRKYDKPVAIPYYGTSPVGSTDIGYVVSQYVPYIIDYGFNHITVGGLDLGKVGYEEYGVDPDNSFPMFDVYRILCSVATYLLRASNDWSYNKLILTRKMSVLNTFFGYFDSGDVFSRITQQIDEDYFIVDDSYRSDTYDDYINKLNVNGWLDGHISTDKQGILNMGGIIPSLNSGQNMCDFYSSVSGDWPPKSALEYCQTLETIVNSGTLDKNLKTEAINWLNLNFDAENEYLSTRMDQNIRLEKMDTLIEKAKNIVSNEDMIPNFKQLGYTATQIVNPATVKIYNELILIFFEVKELLALSVSYHKSILCVMTNQGKYNKYQNELQTDNNILLDRHRYVRDQYKNLVDNLHLVENINFEDYTSDFSIILFWEGEYGQLVQASSVD